jgi:hypothetical protein
MFILPFYYHSIIMEFNAILINKAFEAYCKEMNKLISLLSVSPKTIGLISFSTSSAEIIPFKQVK